MDLKEDIRKAFLEVGAVAVGFARAEEVDAATTEAYRRWIAEGCHAGMDYLASHATLKTHPRFVMEGAATVVSCAFSYASSVKRDPSLPVIASYALGEDYHDGLRY